MITFKRKIYEEMLEWKREDDGKTALLIQGARRVGYTKDLRKDGDILLLPVYMTCFL